MSEQHEAVVSHGTARLEMLGKSALNGFSVLLVEDDADTQEAVKKVLETEGARVTAASSAPEGLQAFLSGMPDVIVCDLGLPGMDGYALIRQIRELPMVLGGRTGAVALTAYSAEMPTKVMHAGFQAYLTKPVEPGDLITAVATLAVKARQ